MPSCRTSNGSAKLDEKSVVLIWFMIKSPVSYRQHNEDWQPEVNKFFKKEDGRGQAGFIPSFRMLVLSGQRFG
jgi:hypothetical protein